MTALDPFKALLHRDDLAEALRSGLIGETARVAGRFGSRPMLYADYVASGRALWQVETYVLEHVLPYYANTHTDISYCGAYSTSLREAARAEIARMLGGDATTHVIFAGSGATSGLNRVVGLLDIPAHLALGGRAVVLVGPYEHHSNLLPWRESGAEVIEIAEDALGGPDIGALEDALQEHQGALLVGAFSAMSNVTGIVTDTDAVTRVLKRHGALAVWDYAGGAPYLPMQMQTAPDAQKDAIVFSPHKFPGGPAASGVLMVRDSVVRRDRPTQPGGGTVAYVSSRAHLYLSDVVAREEAGTPNTVGDIRAALVMLIKEALGQDWITARNTALRARALVVWQHNPGLDLLGNLDAQTLPVFAFRPRDAQGRVLCHHRFARLLSEVAGIQARSGCACAGPYGHRLLGVSPARSDDILADIKAGRPVVKPGWVRVNLSYLLTDAKADAIILGINDLARNVAQYSADFAADFAA